MYIEFQKLRFKNFLPYGNKFTEYDFENGIDIITGENGAGKSSILESLYYAIFGKSYRKIKNEFLINDINKEHLLVELSFKIDDDNYLIQRGIKPNVFKIYKNGDVINEESNVRKYQKILLNDILKINEETFRQLIFLGSNTQHKNFFELNKDEKEEVFNDIIDVSIFKKIEEHIKEKLKYFKTKKIDVEYKIQILNTSINEIKITHEKYDKEIKEKNKKRKDDLIFKIQEQKLILDKSQKILEKSIPLKKLYKRHEEELKKLKKQLKETEILKVQNTEKLKYLETVLQSHECCIGCENLSKIVDVDPDDKGNILFRLNMIEGDLKYIKQNIEEYTEKQNSLKEKLLKVKKVVNEFKNTEKRITEYENELQVLENENIEFKELQEGNLKKLQEEYEEQKEKLQEIDDKINQFMIIKNIVIDSDLKNVIIKKNLPILNKFINDYLEVFNFNKYRFIINSEFEEEIYTVQKTQKSYNQLSNGEKFRFLFSFIFGLLRYIEYKNGVRTNILITDEILDTSLDVDGRQILLDVLYTFKDKNVIIITHNEEIKNKSSFFNRVYKIKKNGKFSTLNVDE